MAASELATSYVTLIPSLKGAEKAIERQLKELGWEKMGENAGDKMGDGASKKLGAKLKSGLKSAAIAAGAVAATAFAGAFAIGKQSLDNYADYEQLVGGVETLFKDSSDQLQEYAANAYKTAGMSANEYMEQATSFSASLIKSLGGDTAKAADYANMAITDMSDNANKMGTSMEMIQNAYNGFAKQNYTMLDNLKLGYGGTKEEMQKLLNDATALSGIEYDISNYADIVDAIHVIQTEMGITGTTAKEASATIAGSIDSAKAAWSNWLTGLADENADMSALTDQLVDSVVTAAGNVIPRIGVIVTTLGSTLVSEASGLLDRVIASFGENGTEMGDAALSLFGSIVSAVGEIAPKLLAAISLMLASVLVELVNKGAEIFNQAVTWASGVMSEIGRGFSEGFDRIGETVSGWLTDTKSKITTKWNEITSWLSAIPGKIAGFFTGIASKISGYFTQTVGNIKNAFNDAVNFVKSIPGKIVDFFRGIGSKITSAFGSIRFPQPQIDWSSVNILGKSISVPKISFYASGGIVTDPTLGVIGEAGYDEAVVPLTPSKLKPFAQAVAAEMGGSKAAPSYTLEELAAAIAQALEGANITANTYLDGFLVGSGLAPHLDRINATRQMLAEGGAAL